MDDEVMQTEPSARSTTSGDCELDHFTFESELCVLLALLPAVDDISPKPRTKEIDFRVVSSALPQPVRYARRSRLQPNNRNRVATRTPNIVDE
jgi:hypothetical protein